MKIRKETSGLHLFDRITGYHILFDEIAIKQSVASIAPRTLSLAITNKCDCTCPFCYVTKGNDFLNFDFITSVCKEFDTLGGLEVTLGGGEPMLHPDFVNICKWIWNNTELGLSITTNGHFLNTEMIDQLKSHVSSIRFSIDGSAPFYHNLRGKSLDNILPIIGYTSGKIPFGINTVVLNNNLNQLTQAIDMAINLGAIDLLVIPEMANDNYRLNSSEWLELSEIIHENNSRIPLLLTSEAQRFLNIPLLNISDSREFLFAHISADKQIKSNSFQPTGIKLNNTADFIGSLTTLIPLERGSL